MKATKIQVEIVKRETGFELEMSVEEAQFLCDVVTSIGGSANSRRGLADRFCNALSVVGLKYSRNRDFRGSIYFMTNKEMGKENDE